MNRWNRTFLTALAASALAIVSAASAEEIRRATDYDGDGLGDLILYDASRATFTVRPSSTLALEEVDMRSGGASIGDVPALGDFNGDGKADLAVFNRTTAKWTIKITGGNFRSFTFGQRGDIPVPARYSGDNCTNVATYNRRTGVWRIGNCEGTSPSTITLGGPAHLPVPADFDCDGHVDLAVYNQKSRRWTIRQSGSNNQEVSFLFGLHGDIPTPGDWDGNGCGQAAVYRPLTNDFFVNTGYEPGKVGSSSQPLQWGLNGDRPVGANVDGDNKVDLVVFRPSEAAFYITTSTLVFFKIPLPLTTASLTAVSPISPLFSSQALPIPVSPWMHLVNKVKGDYNRDNRADFVVARVNTSQPSTTWHILHNTGQQYSITTPAKGDALVPGDFNGDGKTQPAVVTVRDGTPAVLDWRTHEVDGSVSLLTFGLNGDTPIVGDFDCDGKDDRAVVREVNGQLHWFADLSSGPEVVDVANRAFGLKGDKVFAADVTGDGCDEIVISREFLGHTIFVFDNLIDDQVDTVLNWGLPGDQPLTPADINGDGISDFIVGRTVGTIQQVFARYSTQETWGNQFPNFRYLPRNFGLANDVQLTGNFSGINQSEFAVFRRTGQPGFIVSRRGQFDQFVPFGLATDIVVRPDGTVAQPPANIPTDPGFPGGGGGSAPGCNASPNTPTSFVDGAGSGSLWKPHSEGVANGAPALLFPRSYLGSTIHILSSTGQVVSDIQRTGCCHNGNRAHFWARRTASQLRPHAPLTVRIRRPDGATECRVVPDPTRRYD